MEATADGGSKLRSNTPSIGSGLDAICARLKLNADIRKSSTSISVSNVDGNKTVESAATTTISGAETKSSAVNETDGDLILPEISNSSNTSDNMDLSVRSTNAIIDCKPQLQEPVDNDAAKADVVDCSNDGRDEAQKAAESVDNCHSTSVNVSSAGRRNRRKNFLPRCIQAEESPSDVISTSPVQPEPELSVNSPGNVKFGGDGGNEHGLVLTEEDGVEADQVVSETGDDLVLDLRVSSSTTSTDACHYNSDVGSQVLDLSTPSVKLTHTNTSKSDDVIYDSRNISANLLKGSSHRQSPWKPVDLNQEQKSRTAVARRVGEMADFSRAAIPMGDLLDTYGLRSDMMPVDNIKTELKQRPQTMWSMSSVERREAANWRTQHAVTSLNNSISSPFGRLSNASIGKSALPTFQGNGLMADEDDEDEDDLNSSKSSETSTSDMMMSGSVKMETGLADQKNQSMLLSAGMKRPFGAAFPADTVTAAAAALAYIKAVGTLVDARSREETKQRQQQATVPDYAQFVRQNIKRYDSYVECGAAQCRDKDYKEHFHCTACSTQLVSLKKDKIIRHFKWHKKRDDSLQQGFMRFGPLEDCTKKFTSACVHNGRNTHYHCLQDGCNKVYISTSDVQMHSNYHRKDSAIIQEGFQRFRATENCFTSTCMFADQKTTHFHCRRTGCSFTFKNKSDMEKHKMYHQKDEMLTRDGFKKFMKYEPCHFAGCPYSHLSNHIHCIRPGCNYVLHSSGQLFSHKRKHERRNQDRTEFKRFRSILPASSAAAAAAAAGVPPMTSLLSAAQTSAATAATRDLMKTGISAAQSTLALPGSRFNDQFALMASDSSCSSSVNFFQTTKSQDDDQASAITEPDVDVSRSSSTTAVDSVTSRSATGQLTSRSPDAGSGTAKEFVDIDDLASLARLKADVKMPISDLLQQQQQSVRPSESSPTLTQLMSKRGDVPCDQSLTLSVSSSSNSTVEPSSAITTALAMPLSVPLSLAPPINDRRERDESWKKYLTRYTANDVCRVQCPLLYKDHYHCTQSPCTTVFRSKDGVRDHARMHEQQERVTSLTFTTSNVEQPQCPDDCKHSGQLLHYHCNWDGCDSVVLSTEQVFARLEHHKSHEVTSRRSSLGLDGIQKRRGRPSRSPAAGGGVDPADNASATSELPTVPRKQLTDEEVQARAAADGPATPSGLGFELFKAGEPCPDSRCIYRETMLAVAQDHYHCVRQRCHFVEVELGALTSHAQEFHGHVTIAPGFEYYDGQVDCRRRKCHCRGGPVTGPTGQRHFHCVQPHCDYSFVRVSTMTSHVCKLKAIVKANGQSGDARRLPSFANNGNHLSTSASVSAPSSALAASLPTTTGPLLSTIQRAIFGIPSGGSFFTNATSSTLASSMSGGSSDVSSVSKIALGDMPLVSAQFLSGLSSSLSTMPTARQLQSTVTSLNQSSPLTAAADGLPLTQLLQRDLTSGGVAAQLSNRNMASLGEHYCVNENCLRPFCKLKKRDHYHCKRCGLAFSDALRMQIHMVRQCSAAVNFTSAALKVEPTADHAGALAASGSLAATSTITAAFTNPLSDVASGSASRDGEQFDDKETMELSRKPYVNELDMKSIDLKANGRRQPMTDDDSMEVDDSGRLYNDDEDDDDDDDPDDGELVINLSSTATDDRQLERALHRDRVDADEAFVVENNNKPLTVNSLLKPNGGAVVCNSSASAAAAGGGHGSSAAGYERFRFSEDCHYDRCTYRRSMTHYHCCRADCGYAFCDRARYPSHAERHRRVDAIVGDTFVQCHAKVACPVEQRCPLSARGATHYHCRLCPFVCTDMTKVTAHQKRHGRLDRIAANGFRRYGVGDDCGMVDCAQRGGFVLHYHCTRVGCEQQSAAVSAAQMSTHRARFHGEIISTSQTHSAMTSLPIASLVGHTVPDVVY